MQQSKISFLRKIFNEDSNTAVIVETQINDIFSSVSLETSSDNQQILSQLSSFVRNLTFDANFSENTGIMPPGVLYIDSNVIIFERPPQYQNIQLIPQVVENIDYDRCHTKLYRLPIPWQVYICSYSIYGGRYYPNSIRMYFMDSSLTGSDISNHRIYLPTLPNFYTSGLLCNPMYASMDDIERYDNNISGVIQASYDWIWNTGTNLDLTMNIVEAFFQLIPLKAKNIPTIFDKDLSNHAPQVYISSFYLDFSSVDFFFNLWEQFDLHEVSSLTWPNSSTSDRVIGEARDLGEVFLQDFFTENNITDPPYRVENNDSECPCQSDSENFDCNCDNSENSRNVYLYNAEHYGRYVRSKLSSMLTLAQALENIRKSNQSHQLYDEDTIFNISRAIVSNAQLSL